MTWTLGSQAPASRRRRTHPAAHLLWIVPLTGVAASVATVFVVPVLDGGSTGDTLFLLLRYIDSPKMIALAWNAASVWLLLLAVLALVGLISKALPLGVSIPSLVGGVLLGLTGLFIGLFVTLISVMHAPSYGTPLGLHDRPLSDEIVIEYGRFGEHVVWHGGPIFYEHVADFACDYVDPDPSPCYEVETGPRGDVLVTPEGRIPLP